MTFQIPRRGTPLWVLEMAVGLHQPLQRMSTDMYFSEMVDTLVRKSHAPSGGDASGCGILTGLDIVAIVDQFTFHIGSGKEGRSRELEVWSWMRGTVMRREYTDEHIFCTLFHPQQVDGIRTWTGFARIAAAIELHNKGHLLVAATKELEHKSALSAALIKDYSNFNDCSCPQFLEWLSEPRNYGTTSHGDVSKALQ